MSNGAALDLSDSALRFVWMRDQAALHRGMAFGDGSTKTAELLEVMEMLGSAPVGADLRHGIGLLTDRSVTDEFKIWQRRVFENPNGPLRWQQIAEKVECDLGPAISIWKNIHLDVWVATPEQNIGDDRAPTWSLRRLPNGQIAQTPFLSFPSVWGWLWTRFFSCVSTSGFSTGAILAAGEVQTVFETAASEMGPARFEYANEVFLLGDGVSLYLVEVGGDWISHLVIENADVDFGLSDAFLAMLNCSRPAIARAINRQRAAAG